MNNTINSLSVFLSGKNIPELPNELQLKLLYAYVFPLLITGDVFVPFSTNYHESKTKQKIINELNI